MIQYIRIIRRGLRFIKNEIRFSKQEETHRKNSIIFKNQNNLNKRFEWASEQIIINEATAETEFDRHYIYHPAWAVRVIKKTAPIVHYDISSTLTFSSILSAFIPVRFYDYRPAKLNLSGLESDHIDLTNLSFDNDSISSLSCMHTVEHIGLGRYGDAIDYDGDLKAMKELSRVLAPGGNLLFVVPIGNKSVIHFNAHRIYTRDSIINVFNREGLSLVEFTLIPESSKDGGLLNNPDDIVLARQAYGCGCFWFTK